MWALEYGVEIWNRGGASVRVLPAPQSIQSMHRTIFPNPARVVLSKSSKLFLIGNVVIESLFLGEGEDLTIEAAPSTSIIVRALSRSQVRVLDGGIRAGEEEMNDPALLKGRVYRHAGIALSYLHRVSSFPIDGTATRAGTYIYTGGTLLPASACSEDDLHTYHLMGATEVDLAEVARRDSGVHTPFQHCCCMRGTTCV